MKARDLKPVIPILALGLLFDIPGVSAVAGVVAAALEVAMPFVVLYLLIAFIIANWRITCVIVISAILWSALFWWLTVHSVNVIPASVERSGESMAASVDRFTDWLSEATSGGYRPGEGYER